MKKLATAAAIAVALSMATGTQAKALQGPPPKTHWGAYTLVCHKTHTARGRQSYCQRVAVPPYHPLEMIK